MNALPGMVALEIQKQIPGYLDQNRVMQGMLQDHSVKVQRMLDTQQNKMLKVLEDKAREVLNQIVGDERYHEINKMYFDEFRSRGDDAIDALKLNAKTVNEELKSNVENTTSNLKSQLEKLNSLERENKELRERLNSLSRW